MHTVFNPRRACAARVIVCLSVQLYSVCTTLQASVVKGTLKFRHQRSVNDTLQCFFDSWILLTMLGSRDMVKFVSQEAYDRSYTYSDTRTRTRSTRSRLYSDVISEWSIALLFYLPSQLTTAIQIRVTEAARGADERK